MEVNPADSRIRIQYPPAEAPGSSESRKENREMRRQPKSALDWNSDCPTSQQDLGRPEKVAGGSSVLKFRAGAAVGEGPQGDVEQATWKTEIAPRRAGARSVNSARWP
jgi:hypothetical protein